MYGFWAVIGRMCLDPEFHEELFERAKPRGNFEELRRLIEFLRIDNRLPLGRGDVANVNRIVSGIFSGDRFRPHARLADDREVAAIREGVDARSLPFPEKLNFCAAFGLACMDRNYRRMLVAAPSAEHARRELATLSLDHPQFELTRAEAEELHALVREKERQISAFHVSKWMIPDRIACDGGFSLDADAPFLQVAQPDVVALLRRQPRFFATLFGEEVVHGNAARLQETFLAKAA